MVIFDENQAVSDINKYEFLYPIYAKIINFLVIWHHFYYFYVNEWPVNPSKSMKNSLRTCQFHRFWNCGLLSTSILVKPTVFNQFLCLLPPGENLLATIHLVLSYNALLSQFLTIFGRILTILSKNGQKLPLQCIVAQNQVDCRQYIFSWR